MQQVEIGHGSKEKLSVNNQNIFKDHSELFFSLPHPFPSHASHDWALRPSPSNDLKKTRLMISSQNTTNSLSIMPFYFLFLISC